MKWRKKRKKIGNNLHAHKKKIKTLKIIEILFFFFFNFFDAENKHQKHNFMIFQRGVHKKYLQDKMLKIHFGHCKNVYQYNV
jgi:hypothetical protein